MKGKAKGYNSSQQANRIYLVVILLFSLGLFSLNVASIVKQEQAIQELSASNYRNIGGNVVRDLEQQLFDQVSSCLSEENIRSLQLVQYAPDSLEQALMLRERLSMLKKRHAVADNFFVIRAGKVAYPRIAAPAKSFSPSFPDYSVQFSREFAGLMKNAARMETDGREVLEAARYYLAAAELNVTNSMKAMALSQGAEALLKSGDISGAAAVFGRLISEFGDEYDQSGFPHMLRLASRSNEILSKIFPSPESFLLSAHEKLADDHWELSVEEAELQAEMLESKLGLHDGNRPSNKLTKRLTLARALERHLHSVNPSRPLGIQPGLISYKGNSILCYSTYAGDPGTRSDTYLGISVDIKWIENSLLTPQLNKYSREEAIIASIIPVHASDPVEESSDAILIPFSMGGWQLRIPSSTIDVIQATATRELFFLGASLAMLLCVLSIGVYLLIRVSRDTYVYRTQSNFVSGVTHELRTPLSLIRLYGELLDDNSFSEDERRRYSRIVVRESERLSRMIDNVLTFASLEDGTKKHYMADGNLAETVLSTLEEFTPYLEQQGFRVRTGIQNPVPQVHFNSQDVSRALMNLLDNAVKYSSRPGLIRVHLWAQDAKVIFEVQDYGIGISSEDQAKIFKPFYRADAADEKGGFGLGLYLVQKIMEAHCGSIELISEKGCGARFRLLFPIAGESAATAATLHLTEAAGSHWQSQ